MNSNLALLEHDQLQMIADFNQSIIEAMISFDDKKTDMRRQGYSEAQIALQEGEFWAKVGQAYDKGKAAGSNSTWAGVKAGAAEFGRQFVKLLKGIWAWLKKAFIQLLNIFKNDKEFVRKYEDVLIKAWKDNQDGLKQLTFKINIPNRERPSMLTRDQEQNLLTNMTVDLFGVGQKKVTNDISNKSTDEINNIIDNVNKITFSEKLEVTVDQFMNGSYDMPNGWKPDLVSKYSDMKALLDTFANNVMVDSALSNLKRANNAIDKIEKEINDPKSGGDYQNQIKLVRVNRAYIELAIRRVVAEHKNEKACLITCIAGRRNEKQESAMVLAESFVEASSVEIDNQMAVLDEFWAPYEKLARQLSGINESYSYSSVAADPFEALS